MVVLKRNRSDTVRLVELQLSDETVFVVDEHGPEGWYSGTELSDIDAAIDEYFDRCNNLTRLLAYLH